MTGQPPASQAPVPPPTASPHAGRGELLLILFSGLALVAFLAWGVVILLRPLPGGDPGANGLDAVGKFISAGLLVPMLVISLRGRLGGRLRPARLARLRLLPHLLPLSAGWIVTLVLVGLLAPKSGPLPPALLPFFCLGLLLPAGVIVWTACGGLLASSWRRVWSVLGLGLAGSTLVALAGEALVLGIGVAGVWIASRLDPSLQSALGQLGSQVNATGDLETLLPMLAPLLARPWVLAVLIVAAGLIVPLIEEAAKSLGLWILGRRLRSPAEGFALGALSGAGFALVEGFNAASSSTDMLVFNLLGRAASTLMHIGASAIIGWGIASALLEKRYGRLAAAALAGVGAHGIWNSSVILILYGVLQLGLGTTPTLDASTLGAGLASLAGLGLLVLTFIAMLTVLPLANRALQPRAGTPAAPEAGNDIIGPAIS